MRNWIIAGLSLAMIMLYQNCSGRHENIEGRSLDSAGTTIDDVDMAKSLVAFERTLFPITQVETNCVACHGVDQQPLHSLANVELAHDVMISFGLVNLRDPANSKIVDKIRDGHQGFDAAMADQIQAAIQDWSDELVANGGLIGVGDGVQPLYSSLFTHVFEPKCLACHSPDGEAPEIDYSDYITTINTGQVIPLDAGMSGVYIHTSSGEEPRGSFEALTPEELNALATWINRGALNN